MADYIFDLSDYIKSFEVFEQIQPTIIINLASLTSVELCEEKINQAYMANTRTVQNIVHWIKTTKAKCHLVQISTDHVYDGTGPHTENDITITNNYAFSKFAGELSALQVPSTILRTNFVGRGKSSHRESLSDWVYNSIIGNKNVEVLNDVYFSPLSIETLSKMIVLVIKKKPLGIYNLGSRNGMSKAEFDFKFAEYLNLPTHTMTRIDISKTTFYKAYRPKDMRLDSSKFENEFGIIMPDLIDIIKEIAHEYKNEALPNFEHTRPDNRK